MHLCCAFMIHVDYCYMYFSVGWTVRLQIIAFLVSTSCYFLIEGGVEGKLHVPTYVYFSAANRVDKIPDVEIFVETEGELKLLQILKVSQNSLVRMKIRHVVLAVMTPKHYDYCQMV